MTQQLSEFSIALRETLGKKLSLFPSSILGQELDMIMVKTNPFDIVNLCDFLKNDTELMFTYFASLTVVDYEQVDKTLEVVYHLISLTKRYKLTIKSSISSDNPTINSVTNIWRAADWFEREAHDLFGVFFEGHPNLKPLLLYEGFEGYPGRKSFPFHEYKEW